jgi:hypothetical protein
VQLFRITFSNGDGDIYPLLISELHFPLKPFSPFSSMRNDPHFGESATTEHPFST